MDQQINISTGKPSAEPEDTTVTKVEPVVTKEPEPAVKEPDLITRVSQVKAEPVEPVEEDTKVPDVTAPDFNINDIDKIQDPAAKEYALKAYKSFQRGFNVKFQEIADLRKSLEKQQEDGSVWTPERVQGLLSNPEFVKSAQTVTANQAPTTFGGTQEDWSGLSETDQANFKKQEDRITLLEKQNLQTQRVQQDEQLKTKYNNYDSSQMDIITNDVLEGKTQITREHIWKAYDYEPAIQRAYQLGKEDRKLDLTDKVNASTIEGGAVTSGKDVPVINKGESNQNYFERIALSNLLKSKQKESVRQ